ncbi:MAG: DUF1848 domain-containing protein [Spirochaetaceae bacterium]|jgi:hypothetical protein|nr:DUF1848 domain-containing protein [Spirochaetaceae bacterium]
MIISASRRTDIPAFYADWLINRIREGTVWVRNPFNPRQAREITISPATVDGMVFWSKNPEPMLGKLDSFKDYAYYFQFTLNAYLSDAEAHLPPLSKRRDIFMRLSDKIGPERIIWRYDPVLLNDTYTVAYHIDQFGETAEKLRGYTRKTVFSFIDFYKKIETAVKRLGVKAAADDDKNVIAAHFASIARSCDLLIDTCAEDIDLSKYGISHGRCIDGGLLSAIGGTPVNSAKDKNQRPECGCTASVDIGMYDSCPHGCAYCYANSRPGTVQKNIALHDPLSPLLVGALPDSQ